MKGNRSLIDGIICEGAQLAEALHGDVDHLEHS
jgi:hypothetical protein